MAAAQRMIEAAREEGRPGGEGGGLSAMRPGRGEGTALGMLVRATEQEEGVEEDEGVGREKACAEDQGLAVEEEEEGVGRQKLTTNSFDAFRFTCSSSTTAATAAATAASPRPAASSPTSTRVRPGGKQRARGQQASRMSPQRPRSPMAKPGAEAGAGAGRGARQRKKK